MILVDEHTAVMGAEDFRSLLEYSCSLPTGTAIGKRWKRGQPYDKPTEWFMGEYAPDPDPKFVRILWRRIEVVQ